MTGHHVQKSETQISRLQFLFYNVEVKDTVLNNGEVLNHKLHLKSYIKNNDLKVFKIDELWQIQIAWGSVGRRTSAVPISTHGLVRELEETPCLWWEPVLF